MNEIGIAFSVSFIAPLVFLSITILRIQKRMDEILAGADARQEMLDTIAEHR